MNTDIKQSKILILDFGSQYTQLIVRCLRDLGIYCELYAWDVDISHIKEYNPQGIILSGGPESTVEENSPKVSRDILNLNVPILGICYGMQTLSMELGGKVINSDEREFGYALVNINNNSALLKDISDSINVWMSHGDKVVEIPEGFSVLASTKSCPIAMMSNEEKKIYGIQFHPEVTHTEHGKTILKNFAINICNCSPKWETKNIITDIVTNLKTQIKDDKVILGLSGGVDSSVTALLLNKAIGKNLHCIFIDHGLLRLNEANEVKAMFENKFDLNLIYVNAEERFLKELVGVQCPEEKRKIIGRVFIEVFDEEAAKIKNVKWLAQGTIYTDVIESAGTKTQIW